MSRYCGRQQSGGSARGSATMDTSGGGANSKPDVSDKAATPRPSYTYPPVRGYLVSASRVLLLAASVAFLLVCALLSVAITVPRLSRPVGAPAFPTLAATRALPSAVPSTATPAITGTGTPTPPPTSTRHAGGPP